ncbi:MAG: hypothetical protein HYV63_32995 [Candidatus Schekmanbacteria bacterium]|nr:hypothetical protein [Candidatus Schekmanbacteria bacterium]
MSPRSAVKSGFSISLITVFLLAGLLVIHSSRTEPAAGGFCMKCEELKAKDLIGGGSVTVSMCKPGDDYSICNLSPYLDGCIMRNPCESTKYCNEGGLRVPCFPGLM